MNAMMPKIVINPEKYIKNICLLRDFGCANDVGI